MSGASTSASQIDTDLELVRRQGVVGPDRCVRTKPVFKIYTAVDNPPVEDPVRIECVIVVRLIRCAAHTCPSIGRRAVCPLRLSAKRSCEKAALLARMFLASSSLQSPYGRDGPSVSTGATFHPSTPPASGSSCICILSGADLPPLYSCSRIRIHRCSATVRRRGAGHLTALSVHVKHFSSTCMHICIISK